MITGTKGDKLRFPIPQNAGNQVKTAIFGQYATDEARKYFDNAETPLSEKQTAAYKRAIDTGIDAQTMYDGIIGIRNLEPLPGHKGVTKSQKEIYLMSKFRGKQYDLLQKLLIEGD